MNPLIKRRMMTIPGISYKQSPPDSRHITTDIEEISFFCYVVDSVKVVLSKRGREEISGMQLFVAGEDIVKISADDKITCKEKVRQEPLKIDVFYLPGGIPEIGVIYLQ